MQQIGLEQTPRDGQPVLGPLVSIVIEWDNARVAELARARQMYRVLLGQVGRLAGARVIELLFLYDALKVDPAVIENVTAAPGVARPEGVDLQIVGTPGLGYCELKNAGVKRASGDIVVFLDSDVIPEHDWLDEIVRSFRDPGVQLVGGTSYIEPVSVYTRAFALTWFFPLRTPDGPLCTTPYFFANNVAGRREFLARYPFPDQPRFRGQGSTLAETLAAEGIPIYSNPNARVSHPPPNGVSHFVRRALCEGHDLIVNERLRGRSAPVSLGRNVRLSYWALRKKAAEIRESIWSQRGHVGLSAAAAPFAFGIALLYYTTRAVGEILTRIDPRIVRRRFPV
jgi:glycosyltransferase involved in cell wall biosynthesis